MGRQSRQQLWYPLLILLFNSSLLFHHPPPSTATPTTDFDGALALAHATHLAATIGPRPAGSTGEQQAAAWLATQFTNLGYVVTVEPFVFSRRGAQTVGMNVVAVKAGQPDYGTIYLGAHYDAVPQPVGVPGANDNASGVGVLVEAARILAEQPISPTLTLIAFGAEEDQLVGSHAYVAQLSAINRLLAQQAVPQPLWHLYLPLLHAHALSDTAALPADALLQR